MLVIDILYKHNGKAMFVLRVIKGCVLVFICAANHLNG